MTESGIPEVGGDRGAVSVRRLVNDSTAKLAGKLDDEDGTLFEFLCECGDPKCDKRVEMTLAVYRTHGPGSVLGHD